MNLAAMQWAYKLPGLSPASQAVLCALAFHAHKGALVEAFPDLDTLSAETRFSERTVQRAIEDLKQRGLITVTRRRDAQRRQIRNLYTLTMADPVVTVTPPIEEMGNVNGQGEMGKGNGTANSQLKLTAGTGPHHSDVPIPREYAGEDVVPAVDDARLQELINIYVATWQPPLHKLWGRSTDYVVHAWADVCERGWDVPDDLADVFPRVIRLYARNGECHSFASILQRAHRWMEDLEADGWEDDVPIPTKSGGRTP